MTFKRPLSVSPSPPKINNKTSSIELNSCKVCGDKARINNYGTLSCQSCKTFFRRNGFRPELVPLCPYDGECQVNMLTRKLCAACRLGKCFSMGMRTDLIRKEDYHIKNYSLLTESKKKYTSKRKKRMSVSQLSTLDLLQNNRSLLTASEWTLFSNVSYAYDRYSLTPTLNHILNNLSISPDEIHFDVGDVLKIIDCVFTSVRLFVSSTPDFRVLSLNEQQSLFERNLFGVSSFCSSIFFRDTHFLENSTCCNSFITVYGLEMIEQVKHFIEQLDLDSTLFKLMLLVIAFSSNCMIVGVHENMHNDSFIFGTFRLYGSQNIYLELLWKYMLYQYGYPETVIRFSKLVKCILSKIKQAASIYMSNDIIHNVVDEVMKKTKETLMFSQNDPSPLWGKILTSS